ncbi:MAG: type II secretion system F family protein [candidate division Zixibacteria bacterium]|nr:type II secretion system F family protein [candidate division Zixibacteria bacterium]
MPLNYKYRAMSQDGSTLQGVLFAHNSEQVEQHLAERNLRPIRIEAVSAQSSSFLSSMFNKIDYEKLIMFTNGLSTMYKAGIPLVRALSIIRIGPVEGRFNTIIDELRSAVQSGRQLSEAMSDHADAFSSVYTSSIAAGEESGKLEYTLDELAVMLEAEMEITRQVKSALRYPLIVIAVLALAFIVILTFVVPRFVDFFAAFDSELPLPTRILIYTGVFFKSYWYLLLALCGSAIFGFNKLISHEPGRLWVDRQLLRIPILGELIIKGNVARFSFMFRILFRSGLPLVNCLRVLSSTVKNAALGHEIKKLEELFRKGKDLESATDTFKWFPKQALYMMAIGLESGSLETMLNEIGSHYAKQVSYTSRQLTAIIEPLLTVVLGGFVLLIALAIFLPMWNLIKVVGQ